MVKLIQELTQKLTSRKQQKTMQSRCKPEGFVTNNHKQLQKAGNGANQYQADMIVVQNGIDEKRAREICNEMFAVTRRELTADAYDAACRRVSEFENDLIPKMQRIDGALDAFADPAFQFVIATAHKTAAATDRPADYALLAELLIHRVQRGENRATSAGIHRAVEIVDMVSDDALLGLSVAFAVEQFNPVSGHIGQGLDVLEDLFTKLCYNQLPKGITWLDHLDILDAVRLSSFGELKKLEDYYAEKMPGYCTAGILKDSDDFLEAQRIISDAFLPQDILIPNELNPDFFRLPIIDENSINNISFSQTKTVDGTAIITSVPATEEQIHAMKKIYSLYTKDTTVLQKIKAQFLAEILNRQTLASVRDWWNSIPSSFNITVVGRVLAHANAKRCDNSLPDLD